MNVDQLLDLMEETLEESAAMPFAGAKRLVDVDRMRDIIDEVRNNLPDEIRDSKKIVADREQILSGARQEGDNIIKLAEERARGLVSEQEIVKRAKKYAAEVVSAAKAQADEIKRGAANFCEDVLKKSEESLAQSIADIKKMRMSVRSVSSTGAARTRPPKR